MSNRYDHALGRLDALFEEAKRIRDEVESMKAAEQARLMAHSPEKLAAIQAGMAQDKPAPVIERLGDLVSELCIIKNELTRRMKQDGES